MANDTAVIVTGGAPVDPGVAARLPSPALVLAADSGLEHAAALGLDVDLVVGDMDSVRAAALSEAADAGAAVERHPADKDATDLELAMDAAVARGAKRVVVVGGGGGRLDHLLANALLLGRDAYAHLDVEWRLGPSRVAVVRDEARLDGEPGDLVSLLPLGGPATGVATTGLRWQLDGDTLPAGTTRGVSNELTDPPATISLDGGVLLAVHTPSGHTEAGR